MRLRLALGCSLRAMYICSCKLLQSLCEVYVPAEVSQVRHRLAEWLDGTWKRQQYVHM